MKIRQAKSQFGMSRNKHKFQNQPCLWSLPTVIRSVKKVKKVLAAIDKLGYVYNRDAVALRSKRLKPSRVGYK